MISDLTFESENRHSMIDLFWAFSALALLPDTPHQSQTPKTARPDIASLPQPRCRFQETGPSPPNLICSHASECTTRLVPPEMSPDVDAAVLDCELSDM